MILQKLNGKKYKSKEGVECTLSNSNFTLKRHVGKLK
jgi:hypothetical protein